MTGDFGEQLITKELNEMNLEKLHNEIAAVCPINGISIGNATDKSTWTFNATEVATDDEKTAAQAVIDAADPSILNDIVYIDKLVVVDRLISIGKLSDAFMALNSDAIKKARWDAATEIAIDDPDVIMVLAAIGVDPSTVLY